MSTSKFTTNNFFHLTNDQSPYSFLMDKSVNWKLPLKSEEFCKKMDKYDPIGYMRQEFYYPRMSTLPKVDSRVVETSDECTYLCGQSLGLMPVRTSIYMEQFLNDWATLGVYGHFTGSNPWAKCDIPCVPTMSTLVGGHKNEVAVMNQLSSNLHFLMSAFYQPKDGRYKILYEDRAFPSDQYAIKSQIRSHGYDPEDATIIIKPRDDEHYIRTEDIVDIIQRQGDSIALILIGGIHYYTGQLFDIETITRVGHEYGCCVGWDLAHAVGNVPLKLHDWQVDFAAWCTYKYLNGGAGCIGAIFVHSNHMKNKNLKTLDGWWGNRESTRFAMFDDIDRDIGAKGFRVSNPSIHQCAALAASLEIFEEVGIQQIRDKSLILTEYLQYLIHKEVQGICDLTQLTPTDYRARGAQLSFRPCGVTAQQIHDELEKFGVVIDIRDDIMRIAPVSLYNSFTDVYRFVSLLKQSIIRIMENSEL